MAETPANTPPSGKQETKRDDALRETFPASDPPSTTPPPGSRKAEQTEAASGSAGSPEPKGYPTSDRHAAETAAAPSGDLHGAHTRTK